MYYSYLNSGNLNTAPTVSTLSTPATYVAPSVARSVPSAPTVALGYRLGAPAYPRAFDPSQVVNAHRSPYEDNTSSSSSQTRFAECRVACDQGYISPYTGTRIVSDFTSIPKSGSPRKRVARRSEKIAEKSLMDSQPTVELHIQDPLTQHRPAVRTRGYDSHIQHAPPKPPPKHNEHMVMTREAPAAPRPLVNDIFLCGNLLIHIHEAADLPNVDSSTALFKKVDKTDPYVRILIDNKKGPSTRVISNDLNPHWEEHFVIPLVGAIERVTLSVKDDDMTGATSCGEVHLTPADFLNVPVVVRQWYNLQGCPNTKKTPRICVSLQFVSTESLKDSTEVPQTAFPQRSGCKVTLYQDAHIDDQFPLPKVPTAVGDYMTHKCWIDLYMAIRDARHFIYITGWSVWTAVRLIRTPVPEVPEGSLTLGDTLKQKASQGVKVLLLVWNDLTSIDNVVANSLVSVSKTGLMGTYDEETKQFFAGSGVVCELVSRVTTGFATHGRFAQGTTNFMSSLQGKVGSEANFTHHQKSIILDTEVPGNPTRRRIIAFVGGLDVTAGRYDTPQHSIFSTLQTTHIDDFYNGMHPGFIGKYGPREPWHDIHAKVEGPIARDVLENFQCRWFKQAHSKSHCHLVSINSIAEILSPPEDVVTKDSWKVQLFRSIDASAAMNVNDVEADIQQAYIHAIRRAERYIYVENQYFLGSSTEWIGFDDHAFNVEAKHRIPFELVMRIIAKIRQGERFAV